MMKNIAVAAVAAAGLWAGAASANEELLRLESTLKTRMSPDTDTSPWPPGHRNWVTARGFFGFFAEPAPAVDEKAREAVQHGLDTGQAQPATAHRYGRLLQSYELMFWNSVAE